MATGICEIGQNGELQRSCSAHSCWRRPPCP
jgi:hypothetical protein